MNPFTRSPARAQRRADQRTSRSPRRLSAAPSTQPLPSWAFRFVHPFH
jgi:hypothetical protein